MTVFICNKITFQSFELQQNFHKSIDENHGVSSKFIFLILKEDTIKDNICKHLFQLMKIKWKQKSSFVALKIENMDGIYVFHFV